MITQPEQGIRPNGHFPDCGITGQAPANVGAFSGTPSDQRDVAQPTVATYGVARNFPPGLSLPEGEVDQPLSPQDLNLLVKFLQTMGDLPKLELGAPRERAERLQMWKLAMRTVWPLLDQ